MGRALPLFPDDVIPRKKSKKLMHVHDAGSDYGHVNMVCRHCGYDDNFKYTYDATVSDLKRGLPCPKCNDLTDKEKEMVLPIEEIYAKP